MYEGCNFMFGPNSGSKWFKRDNEKEKESTREGNLYLYKGTIIKTLQIFLKDLEPQFSFDRLK